MTRCAVAVVAIFLFDAARGGIPLRGATGSTGQTSFIESVGTPGTYGTTARIIIISGDGRFSPGGASAAGTWSMSAGAPTAANNLASGTWIAMKMSGLVSYGIVSPRAVGGNLTLLVQLHFDGSAKLVMAT